MDPRKENDLIFQVKMRRGFSCLSLRGLGERGVTGGPSRVGRSYMGTSVPTANMARGGSWGLSRAQSQQRWQREAPRKETEVGSSKRWENHQKDPKQAQSYVLLSSGVRIPAVSSQCEEGRTGYKLSCGWNLQLGHVLCGLL